MPGRPAAASKNVYKIKSAVFPTDITQVCSFLNACNVYKRYIKRFSKIFLPYNEYVRKCKELDWLKRRTEDLNVFITLKFKLIEIVALALPQSHWPDMVFTDASA